jgi:hypothetical protein
MKHHYGTYIVKHHDKPAIYKKCIWLMKHKSTRNLQKIYLVNEHEVIIMSYTLCFFPASFCWIQLLWLRFITPITFGHIEQNDQGNIGKGKETRESSGAKTKMIKMPCDMLFCKQMQLKHSSLKNWSHL